MGKRIFAIRGKESRKVFADDIGVGTDTLQCYENDKSSPDISFLIKLQEMTEYSFDYLVHNHDVINDKALIPEKYDQADNDTQNQLLILLLGVGTAIINHTSDNYGYINKGKRKGEVKFSQ